MCTESRCVTISSTMVNWHQIMNGPPGTVNIPEFADSETFNSRSTAFVTLPNRICVGELYGPREATLLMKVSFGKQSKSIYARRSGLVFIWCVLSYI